MEDDPRAPEPRERPRPGVGAVARSVTLSVPDLERSRRFFVDALGLEVADGLELHGPEHEALWGLEGATRESLLLWADDMLVELVHYAEPEGRPWPPGYRISDQGLLNIAFGFRRRAEFEAAHRRCLEAGLSANGPPLRLGAWSVVYVNDDQGFSVELLHVEPWYERQMGFRPRPTPRLAPLAGRTPARLRAERRFAKALVTGAAGGLGTELARLAAEDGTSLVLLDRDADGLSRLAAELGDGAEVATLELDLADLEAVDSATAELVAEHPDIDLLIAAAGLDRAQSLLAFDWRQARDDFTVNSLANLVLLSHLAPAMAEARRRPRDRDRQPRRAGRDALRGPLQRQQGGPGGDRRVGAGRARAGGDQLHRGLPGLRGHADVPRQRLQAHLQHRSPRRGRADLHGDAGTARDASTSRPASTPSCAWRGCFRRACATG